MKIIALICLLFILILPSCCDSTDTNDDYTSSDAKIIGYDYRKCMCCGGWFVALNKDTLRIWNMPEDFTKILDEKELPVDVHLSWKKITDGCGATMDDIILVNTISLR
ncbi:MAG: hypothetical protein A2X61_03765 [Ignavibacteria bacterium GWB2_35_12]|nr:MAG: hypothetical protein A2X63_00930 [Ignavibacteria bacterium GWA2_35_8]OGU40403.1 MAG: hypothetical protein A2X61_03765 [Ignavibacteria bacterium GWB2_35_12]OGU92196.1 MAG: hypothetical protein A2220_13705 [Ignavibacteria bacterium RIFOXYA2_FULL_35_10]OGV22539.1 MAG: hypothetical protein A2475_03440 [Ignavibacteria bacterium RIFOXYC2_FULL_35_21]